MGLMQNKVHYAAKKPVRNLLLTDVKAKSKTNSEQELRPMVSCLDFQSNDNAHLLHQPIVFCKSKSRIEGRGVKRRVMCCFRDLCYLTPIA